MAELEAHRAHIKAEQDRDEFKRQRDDLSDEMERCHRLLDAHYDEDTETVALDTLEDRLHALLAEVTPLKSALERIQQMAAEDLRQGRTFVCHSYLHQIEADARAALNLPSNES